MNTWDEDDAWDDTWDEDDRWDEDDEPILPWWFGDNDWEEDGEDYDKPCDD